MAEERSKKAKSSERIKPRVACRYCGKSITSTGSNVSPFCSEHCKMQDLSRWFSEGYRIAADPVPMEPDQPDGEEY